MSSNNEPAEKITLDYVPREPFKAFHSRSQRWALLVYHRRAGKTVATVNDLVDKALKCRKPNPKFGYVAPFMSQAESIAWDYLTRAVRKIPGHKIDIAKKRVRIPTSHPSALGTMAEIRLFGADSPDALRGQYFDGIVLDEVAQMKRIVWGEIIRPALTDRKGWAVFIGTPKGKNFFYDLAERAKGSDNWFYQVLKSSESGLLSEEELADAKAESDEETFMQEFECSFTAGIKGSYYAKIMETKEEDGTLAPVPYVASAPVHVVFDLGFSDATACWFWQYMSGEVRVIDHQEWNEVDIHAIIDDIVRKGYKLGDVWLPHDAKARSLQTGISMIETFQKRGIRPKAVPELSIQDGIQAVRQTLPKLRIDGEKCYDGVEALKNYQKKWNAERGMFSNTPMHDWSSHSADSMRYLCLALKDTLIAESGRKSQPQVTPEQARDEWLASTTLNSVSPKSITLDELFARQPRSKYTRI